LANGERKERKRPPTVSQLIRLLAQIRVKCIRKFKGSQQIGEWRPYVGQELKGEIALAVRADEKRGFDALITAGGHELCHAFFNINCNDDRYHHDRVYRWESVLFRSRALREAMALRIGNAYIYGQEEP